MQSTCQRRQRPLYPLLQAPPETCRGPRPRADAETTHNVLRRPDIVKAVAAGTFRVIPIKTINQGIQALTGISAGQRGSDGQFPKNTLNHRVEAQLRAFADTRRQFGMQMAKPQNGELS